MQDSDKEHAAPSLRAISILEWLLLAIGLILSQHYAWLLDDAFIYFRYVDNFLFLKLGWVMNQGEFVEGCSSPLWLLILTALRWTEVNFWWIVRFLGVSCIVALWYLLVCVNRRLSSTPSLFLPLVLLLPNYAVLSYVTSGVEAPLVQVAGVLFACYFAGFDNRGVKLALACTPLLRHELALPLLFVFIHEWWRTRRLPLGWTALTALTTGAWVVYRITFYADLVPNTFHLKDTVEVSQGLRYLHDTFVVYHFYWIALLVVGAAAHLQLGTSPLGFVGARCWMLVTALSVLAYVVKIGGDPRHYRYLAFSYPLLICAGAGVLEAWLKRYASASRWLQLCFAGLFVLTISAYPRQLSSHPIWMNESHRTVAKINDASVHRHEPEYQYASWGDRTTPQRLRSLLSSNGELHYRTVFADYRCVRGYTRMGDRLIHSLGLTDAILAHTNMPAQRPAHKWGLVRLAKDMLPIVAAAAVPGPGMYRQAVEAGEAAPWMKDNLDVIEVIERKIYNQHHFWTNLGLVRQRGRIEPGGNRPPR